MSGPQYAIGLVLPQDPMYTRGYRYVVRSPEHCHRLLQDRARNPAGREFAQPTHHA